MKRLAQPTLLVGLTGLLWGILLAVRLLLPAGWNPSVFLVLGEEAVEQTEYAVAHLGEDVVVREYLGHDGKFFFIQANDPLLLEPAEHASYLDRPTYRSQRMLYPLIASGFGLLNGTAVAWGMGLTNVVAMGLGTWGTARLAQRRGSSPWFGLAFALNLGLVSELFVGGAGLLAFALVVLGVDAFERHREAAAIGWFVLAALSREVALVAPAGLAVHRWLTTREFPIRLLGVPVVAVAAWAAYLRIRLPDDALLAVREIGVPFQGIAQAFARWSDDPLSLLVGLIVVAVLFLYALRVLRSHDRLGWATVGFAGLAFFLTEPVWREYYDISRAIAPVLTGYVVVLAPRRPVSRTGPVQGRPEHAS